MAGTPALLALMVALVVVLVAAGGSAAAAATPTGAQTTAARLNGGPPCPLAAIPGASLACAAGEVAVDQADEAATVVVNKTVIQPLTTVGIKAINSVLDAFVELWLNLSVLELGSQGAVTLYSTTLGLGWLIAAVLLMGQAIQTMVVGRATPLLQALRGLVITGLVAIGGVGATAFLLQFSDAVAAAIMGDLTKNGVLKKQLVSLMLQDPKLAPVTGSTATLFTLLLAILLILIMIVQLVVLLLRNATIPILAVLLPIAAAGQVGGGATRQWLPKIITAVAAVICYKPMVALIIVAAVRQTRNSTSVSGMLYGLLMYLLSLIAMPALMRAFAPLGLAVSGGGGGGMLRMAGDLLMMAGGIASGGASSAAAAATTAADHARNRERDGGDSTTSKTTPTHVDSASPQPAASPEQPSQPITPASQPARPASESAPVERTATPPSTSTPAGALPDTASVADTAPIPVVSPPPATPAAPFVPAAPGPPPAESSAPSGAVPATVSSHAPTGAPHVASGAALTGAHHGPGQINIPGSPPLAAEQAPLAISPPPGDGGTPPISTTGGLTIDDRS
ncbi:hypothetical protein ACQPYK_49075 (plasmid) [Streptosporangium sp. CA-135522]|uniref:hypothetical protein n=1 Tax=Streptosporangium sp. CA-135522 TaxID=3240072 RepID=UPI003D8F8509